jgi:hypothetical protein
MWNMEEKEESCFWIEAQFRPDHWKYVTYGYHSFPGLPWMEFYNNALKSIS